DDVLDTETGERAAGLCEAPPIRGGARRRGIAPPAGAVGVDRARDTVLREQRAQRGHDRPETFAAVDELRIEHSSGGVIDGDDQGVVLRRAQGEPAMATAIKVHEFAEAGAVLAAAPGPAAGA